jgi:hypothetical protein
MSDDLIKRLHNVRLEGVQELCWEAAYCIEDLKESNKELTLQLLATSGQAADALDKLAKAVEYLRKIAAYTHIGTHAQGIVQNAEARIACTALAELEGMK